MQNNLKKIITLFSLYLISVGLSWIVFAYLKAPPSKIQSQIPKNGRDIDPNLPKTEVCPLNGKKFSKPEREIWETRRPLAAIIENHIEARPQSGISYADIVYEAVAEGGITRFLAIFYCGPSSKDVRIAPIRSARVYFVNLASEYGKNPLFLHSGGANRICKDCPGGVKPASQVAREVDALGMLEKLGWRTSNGNALDAGTNLGIPAVVRNQYRLGEKSAWEHSYEGYTDKIFEEAEKRGFGFKDSKGEPWNKNFEEWLFSDDKPVSEAKAKEISFAFWEGKPEYNVSWSYDASKNLYLRFNGGEPHIDFETKNQITAKNVIIQFVSEKGPVDKEGHMFYQTEGEGKAIYFQNGDVWEGKWIKRSQSDRTRFFKNDGSEMTFVRGEIWVELLPKSAKVSY